MTGDKKYYPLTSTKRLDIRYSLIKLNGRSYLVDASNPKDWRTFCAVAYPPLAEFKCYDVTGDERKFKQSTKWKKITGKIQNVGKIYLALFFFLWFEPNSPHFDDKFAGTMDILLNASVFIGGMLFIVIISNLMLKWISIRYTEKDLQCYTKGKLYAQNASKLRVIFSKIGILIFIILGMVLLPFSALSICAIVSVIMLTAPRFFTYYSNFNKEKVKLRFVAEDW